jgi:hypothetical protein
MEILAVFADVGGYRCSGYTRIAPLTGGAQAS